MKHTPGPWEIREEEYDETLGYLEPTIIANADLDKGLIHEIATIRIGLEETPANACLIAAAPELLEASKKLVNEVSSMMGAPELRQMLGNTNFAVLQERWEQMRATIARADGK